MNKEKLRKNSAKFLITLFKAPHNVENIYYDFLKTGYEREDITFRISDKVQRKYFSNEAANKNAIVIKTLKDRRGESSVGETAGTVFSAVGTLLMNPSFAIDVSGILAASLFGTEGCYRRHPWCVRRHRYSRIRY